MATEVEPRRSGRTRKAVKSFAEEQAEQTAAAATASKSGKKRARTSTAPKKSQSAPKHEVLTEITDYTPAAEDEDDYHLEDDEEPSPPPKIAKRSSKKNASETTGQPYGRPPVGTMIEWYRIHAGTVTFSVADRSLGFLAACASNQRSGTSKN